MNKLPNLSSLKVGVVGNHGEVLLKIIKVVEAEGPREHKKAAMLHEKTIRCFVCVSCESVSILFNNNKCYSLALSCG